MLAVLLVAGIPAFSQSIPGTPPDPNASITWPPPVYLLRGEFEIRGSASLPNMTNYFIEFRPLEDTFGVQAPVATEEAGAPEEAIFFPAILPSSTPVLDSVLGVWDTSLVPDGLYEIRLTVNLAQGEPVTHTVSPLRVENEPPPFVQLPVSTQQVPPTQQIPPTQPPPPTVPPTEDPTPRVTVTTPNGNVRAGDGTNYAIVASMSQGQTAEIVGISNTGSGWYQVRLPNGQIGWMAPSIVQVSGNLAGIPRIQPPPPPATPTFTPIPATATPITSANLVAGIVVLNPSSPTCNQTFTVGFDVANLGSQPTAASGIVSLVDTRAADGAVTGSTVGGFPVLAAGQTFRVDMPLTISTYYNELHTITLTIDSANQIPETVEGDNVRTIQYTLAQGSC
jgi:hypothetical protein